jgi:serine O-acetyltransferase
MLPFVCLMAMSSRCSAVPDSAGQPVLGATPPSPQLPLMQQLREDLATYRGHWSRPGFHALAVHRFGIWAEKRPVLIRKALTVVYMILYTFTRNVYGIEVPRSVVVGRRVELAHQHGIVIIPMSQIGDDCIIRHNVTLGVSSEVGPYRAPRLGAGVSVSPGATILGGVTIGDGATVGPGSLVVSNVGPGATVFAPPTRVLGNMNSRG